MVRSHVIKSLTKAEAEVLVLVVEWEEKTPGYILLGLSYQMTLKKNTKQTTRKQNKKHKTVPLLTHLTASRMGSTFFPMEASSSLAVQVLTCPQLLADVVYIISDAVATPGTGNNAKQPI